MASLTVSKTKPAGTFVVAPPKALPSFSVVTPSSGFTPSSNTNYNPQLSVNNPQGGAANPQYGAVSPQRNVTSPQGPTYDPTFTTGANTPSGSAAASASLTNSLGGSGGTGGSGTGIGSFSQYFGGKLYTDYPSYSNAISQAATASFTKQQKNLDDAYHAGLIDFDQRQQSLEANRKAIQQQATDLLTNYNNSLNTLNDSHLQALGNIQGYFSSISPTAYQSQQATNENKANDQYLAGVGDLNTQRTRNDQAISDANSQLDTQSGNLGRSRDQYSQSYQNSLNDLGANFLSNSDSLSNQNLSYANSLGLPVADYGPTVANTKDYSTNDLLKSLAGLFSQNQPNGGGVNRVGQVLGQLGLSKQDQDLLQNYLYSGFTNKFG